jgi:hypothetical protein
VLLSVAVLLWVQANLLVANYGPLDGTTIDWSPEAWRNKYELSMWVGVPLLAIAAARPLASIAAFTGGVLIALQTVLLVGTTLQADQATKPKWRGAPEAMFDVSSSRNAFHLVLDTFNAPRAEISKRKDRS